MSFKAVTAKILLVVAAVAVLGGFYAMTRLGGGAGGQTPADHSDVEQSEAGPVVSGATPDFTFKRLDGSAGQFTQMERPVVLVHFWASWCAPCVVEFPQLMALAARHEATVDLMLVSIDRDVAAVEAFRGKLRAAHPDIRLDGANLHWIWDEGKAISLKRFNTVKVPETLFFGPDRMMRHKTVGETDWNAPDIEDIIRTLSP